MSQQWAKAVCQVFAVVALRPPPSDYVLRRWDPHSSDAGIGMCLVLRKYL
jgi:hypothetical protein